jgi:hypothetical protein
VTFGRVVVVLALAALAGLVVFVVRDPNYALVLLFTLIALLFGPL